MEGVDPRSVPDHSLLTWTVTMQHDIHTSESHNTNSGSEFKSVFVHDITHRFMTDDNIHLSLSSLIGELEANVIS